MIAVLCHHWIRVASLLLAVGALRAVGLLPPIYVGSVIDLLTQGRAQEGLWFVALISALALLRTLASPWVTQKVTGLVQDIVKERSIVWVRSILDKDFRFFRDANLGALLRSTDRGLTSYEVYLTYVIVQVIPNTIELIFIGAYLTLLAGPVIVMLLVVLAGTLAVITVLGIRWRRPYIDAVNDAEDNISGSLAEVIEAGSQIKVMRAKVGASRFLEYAFESYRRDTVRLSFVSEAITSAQTLLVTAATIVTLLYGILVVGQNGAEATVGDFVVVFSFAGMFMANAQRLAEAYRQTDQFRADKAAFDAVLALPAFRQIGTPAPKIDGLQIKPFTRRLTEDLNLVVEHDIFVRAGTSLAIVGETGGGKSSLARTIGGIDAAPGAIFLGGVDVSAFGEDDLFGAVYVDQQAAFFPEGDPAWSVMFQFAGALGTRMLALADELGVGHLLGEGRSIEPKTLSGGERRRLGLLRALSSDAPVVILDEPTESLDLETASRVWELIFREMSSRILVCITHDRSRLLHFDQLIEVERGNARLLELVTSQRASSS